MQKQRCLHRWVFLALISGLLLGVSSFAGVSREIQEQYRQKYENKALFLKIPIFADREYVMISGSSHRPERVAATGSARFKVTEQVRVLQLDFGGDEIKFRLGAIGSSLGAELIFKFDAELQESFPNRDVFDAALDATFSEGLRYADLEDARRDHAQGQFERMVGQLAANSGASREDVLGFIAPRLPAYQEAMREIETYRKRNQEQAESIDRLQTERSQLQASLRTEQSESAKLQSLNASLQAKIDSTNSQLTRIREDLRSAEGERAGYQKELASLQRSLRLRSDASRDLSSQIAEIAQATQRLQREKEELEKRRSSLEGDLQRQTAVNSKLNREIEDLNGNIQKMRNTISTLTSKEDSLARQYLDLKQVNDHLENIKSAVAGLRTEVVEEADEDGVQRGKVAVYLADIPLGTLGWRLPRQLAPQASESVELSFASESIDFVKVAPQERQILQSLGDRLKMKASLASIAGALNVEAEQPAAPQEVGEREAVSWRWRITNQGTEDGRLALVAGLVNTNADEIPLWKDEYSIESASVVRQVRGYLQPIPIALGVVIGMLLFGIVGIFRRPARSAKPAPPHPPNYVDRKGL